MKKLSDYQHAEMLHEDNEILVYRAVDGEKVIIKSTRSNYPSPELLTSFRHEYAMNAGMHLQGLVRCLRLIDEPQSHALIFEDEGGVALDQFLKGQPLSLDQFFPIALSLVDCLAELHDAQVVHKDIKPANLLINPTTLAIKLLDLSLASQMQVELTDVVCVNKLEGSLAYMAPEQTGRMNVPVDYRSDYYALGVTFYELLTGVLPFVCADPLEYVHSHLAIEPKPASRVNPLVPEVLSLLVNKLMSKSLRLRYQSAAGLKADLRRCFNEWKTDFKISTFELGEYEMLDRLTLSSKIYGREQETARLLDAFGAIKKAGVQSVLISGYSGIGKTTLVNELQKPITTEHGHFISAKFDQLQRTTPYSAFTSSFSQLIRDWLTEPEEKIRPIKARIEAVLGESGQVIIDYFPELEWVIGAQPAIEVLPPEQTQSRFFYHFHRFLQAIASEEEPLVLFIDDLQWIDPGSLQLLEQLLTTEDLNALLFIGAYRDNEVDETHPFIQMINKLKKAQLPIQDIVLSPLDLNHTEEFLVDTLSMEALAVRPLAEVLFQKTAGNPFFTRELLKACFSQGSLAFSHKEKRWHWDLEQMVSMSGSSNVVDLMLVKINKLPAQTLMSLQLGSCLGMTFDVAILSLLQGGKELEVVAGLSAAVKEGLIQRTGSGLSYKFIHDRVQQAAYQTLPQAQKEQIHWQLGTMLLSQAQGVEEGALVFDILDHLKRCVALIKTTDDLKRSAQLALVGGRQALDSGAYAAANDYLSYGLLWAKTLCWVADYRLLWDLNSRYIACLCLEGKIQEALTGNQALLAHTVSVAEKMSCYQMEMQINSLIDNVKSTYSLVRKCMAFFGISLPKKVSNFRILLATYWFRLRFGYGSHLAKKVLDMQVTDNEEINRLVNIMDAGTTTLSVRGGYKESTLIIYSIGHYLQKNGGTNWGKFIQLDSLRLQLYVYERNLVEHNVLWNAEVGFVKNNKFSQLHEAHIHYRLIIGGAYVIKIREMQHTLQPAIQSLIELGDLSFLETVILIDMEIDYFSDSSLSEVKNKVRGYLKTANKLGIEGLASVCQMSLISVSQLMEEEVLTLDAVLELMPNKLIRAGMELAFYCYFMEEYVRANEIALSCRRNYKWLNMSINIQMYFTLTALIQGQLYPNALPKEQKKHLKRIQQMTTRMKPFADHMPANFLHLYCLCQAELARAKDDKLMALEYYRRAIAEGKTQGFIRWVAMASERAGSLYIELHDATAATGYIQEAMYFYQLWGCALKVSALSRQYASLLNLKQANQESIHSKSTTPTTFASGDLDMMSLVKASQVISDEIQLDKLLQTMMYTAVENAGAETALFVEKIKNKWMVIAQLDRRQDRNEFTMPQVALSDYTELPQKVIQYALHSKEPVVLANAAEEGLYQEDDYVMRNHPKSVLCLPIVYHDKVIGALYFENNLTTGAFTQNRVMVLNTLASQIAISLENARHFEQMALLYKSTERFVPQSFLRLLHKEHVEDVQLGDSIEATITVMFTDIRDYTTITEKQTPQEAFAFINGYLKIMGPIIRKHEGFINQYQGDAIMALFPRDPEDGVKAVLDMYKALLVYNQNQHELGLPELKVGYGLNTGLAMLGTIGEEERMDANVISDAINLGSRVEALNKFYGTKFLISETTFDSLKHKERYVFRLVDKVRVKGKKQALYLYQVFLTNEVNEARKQHIAAYESAFKVYEAGEFSKAQALFETCLQHNPDDLAVAVFIERCALFVKEGTPEGWDGTYTLLSK